MYKVGDLIVYGNVGVCAIDEITTPDFLDVDQKQLYYVVKPVYQNGVIFAPVDSTKVFMRPVISKEEAERLIDLIPSIEADAFHSSAMWQLTQHYQESLDSHDCEDLLELTMSIYAKKQFMEQEKRKFGAIDEKYMKRAEELLFGELAVALDIPRETVPEYIAEKINAEGRN